MPVVYILNSSTVGGGGIAIYVLYSLLISRWNVNAFRYYYLNEKKYDKCRVGKNLVDWNDVREMYLQFCKIFRYRTNCYRNIFLYGPTRNPVKT